MATSRHLYQTHLLAPSTPPPRPLSALCVSALAPSSFDFEPQSPNSFLFFPLRTLFPDGQSLSPFYSITSALFPVQRRGGTPPRQSLESYLRSNLNPFDATLTSRLINVDSKRLTEKPTSLDATLTKNRGEGLPLQSAAHRAFQVTEHFFRNAATSKPATYFARPLSRITDRGTRTHAMNHEVAFSRRTPNNRHLMTRIARFPCQKL
jgi:hypothetical protein